MLYPTRIGNTKQLSAATGEFSTCKGYTKENSKWAKIKLTDSKPTQGVYITASTGTGADSEAKTQLIQH